MLFPFFVSTLLSTQIIAQKTIFFGLKAGLSIPSLSAGQNLNDWNKDYVSRVGPQFGIFANIPLNTNWSLVPELDFAGQGGKRNTLQPITIPEQYFDLFQSTFHTDKDYLYGTFKNTSRINFLQLPIQLQYHTHIALNGRLHFFAQFGPFIGYMLAAKQIVKSDSLRVFLTEDPASELPPFLVEEFFGTKVDTIIDGKKELYHWNYGIQGGIGFSYTLGKGKLSIEGGGNYGLRYLQIGNEHGKNRIGAGLVVMSYALPFNFNKE